MFWTCRHSGETCNSLGYDFESSWKMSAWKTEKEMGRCRSLKTVKTWNGRWLGAA
jgi:hypothetical protein